MSVKLSSSIYEKLYKTESKKFVDRSLEKLEKAIDNALNKSVTNGYGVMMHERYQVALQEIREAGGEFTLRNGRKDFIYNIIGGDSVLFTDVAKGNGLEGINSYVSLSKNIHFQEIINMSKQFEVEYATSISDITSAHCDQLIDHYFPTYNKVLSGKLSFDVWKKDYDRTPINIKSLNAWIGWCTANKLHDPDASHEKKEYAKISIRQAKHIIGLALGMDGYLYQEKKTGDFFRTYYRGLSVQGMPKDMRQAALGHSYQYDMNSSATAWLFSYSTEYNATQEVPHKFLAMNHFLDNKKRNGDGFFNQIMRDVFLTRTYVNKKGERVPNTKEWSMGKIKEVFAAISFGAKTVGIVCPMKDSEGNQKFDKNGNPEYIINSLGLILKDHELREAFLDHYLVKEFIEERKLLADFAIAKDRTRLKELPFLQDAAGNLKRNSALTYLYNEFETKVMSWFRTAIRNITKDNIPEQKPLLIAKIHDAVVYDKKITHDVLQEVITAINEELKFPYFSFSEDAFSEYSGVNTEDAHVELRDQAIHKLFTNKQERDLLAGFEPPKKPSDVYFSESEIKAMMASLSYHKPVYYERENHGVYDSVHDDGTNEYQSIYVEEEEEPIAKLKITQPISEDQRRETLDKLKVKEFNAEEDRGSVIMNIIKQRRALENQ